MTRPLSGIYKITNNSNGKVYVGQSKNVFIREKEHFLALRHNKHPNEAMHNDWNKSNRGFRFDVIEFCPIAQLNEREKYWIEQCGSMEPNGYNQGWVPYKRRNVIKTRYRQHKYRRR